MIRRSLRSLAAVIALVGGATSRAADAQPAVDVGDLPALPPESDDSSTSSLVHAFAEADEEVVVGAAKREQSLGNVASAVTVVSADRLRRFGYRTVGEAIAAVAGAYLVDNRLSVSIGIRGLQIPGDFNTRILVLIDGASVNEAWGAYAGVGFDALVGLDEIARIEVIRGPVSSVYGTNAFFGIINIVTRGAAETARAWGRAGVHSINGVTSSAGFAVGSVHRQVRGSLLVMDRFGEQSLALPDGGTIHGSKADGSRALVGGVVAAYGGTFAQVRAVRFNRETPFAPYDVSPAGKPYNQFDNLLLVEGGHTRELSKKFSVAGRLFLNLYKFSDTAPASDPVVQPSALDTEGTARVIGGEVRGRYELIAPERLGVTVGSEVSSNQTRSRAFLDLMPDQLLADQPRSFALVGTYAELDGQPTRWLGFTAGVRFDYHSELEDRVSPRAAVFLSEPDKYGVKLLYAEGFRNPSAFEAYFQDGSDFIAHPEQLRAESIRSFEVAAWAKPRPGLSTRLSGFYWDASDIIESRPAPENPALLQFQNVTRYVTRGIEGEVSYRNSQGWYAFGGGAVTQVGTEEAGAVLEFGKVPNAPVFTAGAGVSTPLVWKLAHASLETVVIGARPTRSGAMPSPDAPTWLGLNAAIYFPSLKGFDLTIGGRNLLGKRDLVPTPPDYDRTVVEMRTVPRVPGEGLEIYVKLGYAYR